MGIWEFRSKSKQDLHSLEGGCRGYMFSLEVTEELEIWPEQENRYRKWVSFINCLETMQKIDVHTVFLFQIIASENLTIFHQVSGSSYFIL